MMDFSLALAFLRDGKRVTREGWSGNLLGPRDEPKPPAMFLYLVQGSRFNVNRPPLLGIYSEGTPIDYQAHIDLRTRDGTCVPWVASQTDLLADDWQEVS